VVVRGCHAPAEPGSGGRQTRADPSISSMSRFRRRVRGAGAIRWVSRWPRPPITRDSNFVNTPITVLTCAYTC